jgi:hypothetical protein
MNRIVDQRKDSKQHLPPRSGLHPHPVPLLRPEERENSGPRQRLPVPPKGQGAPQHPAWRRAANQQRNPRWHGHRNRMTRSPASKS